jgi:outer membrane protein OmpA-like peptidoglycan-associated protein
MIDRWSSYRELFFAPNSTVLGPPDMIHVQEIADYSNRNPSVRIGLDGSSANHVRVVRDALIKAGVPASRIETGKFGDQSLSEERRVEVLVRAGR